MSELKDPDDSFDFNLQPDGLDNDEYDELNDETFGDCIQDWDKDQDKLDECIMEMRRIVGESVPEIDLRIAASKFNNNPELALQSILSNQPTININNLDNEPPKSLQPVNGLLKNNLIEDDDDLIKHTLDRVSNQQFNQIHYQLMQQMQQQNQQMNNQLSPSLFLNQQQQFNQQNLQSPHFIQFPQQFLPHLQQHQTPVQNLNQFISQQNNLVNNSLTSNALSDSFASMNLNSNFNQNGVNEHNLTTNDLTNNLNSTFQAKLINQQKNNFSEYLLNQQHDNLLNGNESKPNKPRALTLQELEQELLDGGGNDSTNQQTSKKGLTLEDLETSLFSDLSTTSNHLNQFAQLNHLNHLTNQTNNQFNSNNNFNQLTDQFNNHQFKNQQFNNESFGNHDDESLANINLNNLNEFPKLGEFVKLDKNASSSTTSELITNNDRMQQPKFMKQQNFRNQNFNQNRQNNKNFRNYHPSLIPNPLNPIEMIRNDNVIKNNNGGNFNKYQNKQQYQQRNYQKNNYTHNLSYLNSRNPDDEYAGLMTPRDISWLRRIQQMQLEFDDPYVQDYYFVNYQTKKIAADVKKRDRLNGEIHSSVPQLVIPERGINKLINNAINSDNNSTISSITTDQQSRYIPPDFSGSLGKIRVANVNYPRKLLDFENNSDKLTKNIDTIEPTGRKELNKFRRLLLDIECNLTMVLKIDHEDKKTAALPHDAQIPHLEERKRLCDELFNGILTTNDNKNVNFTIAKIRKGCMLIFKALQVLEEPEQKTIIISDLLKVDNFHHVVMQKDKTIYCLDYGQVLIDAIKTIKNCDFDYLLRIADGLDDASIIAKFQCGQEIIEVLINQYHCFDTIDNNQKIKWKLFLERIKEDIEDISHLNKLCDDNLALF